MRHRSGLSVCPARKNMVTPCISFSLTNRYHLVRPSGCVFIIARFLLSKFLEEEALPCSSFLLLPSIEGDAREVSVHHFACRCTSVSIFSSRDQAPVRTFFRHGSEITSQHAGTIAQ